MRKHTASSTYPRKRVLPPEIREGDSYPNSGQVSPKMGKQRKKRQLEDANRFVFIIPDGTDFSIPEKQIRFAYVDLEQYMRKLIPARVYQSQDLSKQ